MDIRRPVYDDGYSESPHDGLEERLIDYGHIDAVAAMHLQECVKCAGADCGRGLGTVAGPAEGKRG
jgi:hypothetical protein